MNHSEQVNEIFGALALAQSKVVSPKKNRKVTVATKTGGKYEFEYTTLDGIIEAVRGPLTENGLWFTQTLTNGDGKYRLITTLTHKSGQWIASETPLMTGGGGNQEFGSALTYMKRYALSALLGVASDEDDDANSADGNEVKAKTDKKQAPGAPKPIAQPADAALMAFLKGKNLTLPVPGARAGKPDYPAWVASMGKAIDACPERRVLDDLWAMNTGGLADLQRLDVPARVALEQRADVRRAALSPEAIAAE